MTYLNHAGTSWPKPAPVRDAVAASWSVPPDEWAATFAAMHERVARAFGVADPARLLLTPGCTSALNVAVVDHPWTAGDRVLVSGLEHHALHRPATELSERGVEVVVVPRAPEGPLDLDRLLGELDRGRVRLLAMTAACNVTGELLPVPEIVRLAHERDVLCLIDGAQVCGWTPVDVAALGVDMFSFAGHKGLQGPWGIGGLYVAPHVSMSSPSAACELPAGGGVPLCAPMAGYCDVGSVDRAALAGLVAGLDWLDAPARADRLERARGHVERIARGLEERPGVRLHGARAPEDRLPTIAFTVDGRATSELAATFARHGITVGSGLQCAPLAHESLGTAPGGVVRLSAGPSTTDADVEHVLEIVATL